MGIMPRATYQVPDFWNVFGHSYFQFGAGSIDQTGRADSLFRASMDVEHNNWQNRAVPGSCLTKEQRYQGGWTRVYQERVPNPGRSGPYAPDGGALVLCYGINDIGTVGNTTQVRDAFKMTLRAVISRWRASTIFENDFGVGTRVTYGAGFSSFGGWGDVGSGTTVHVATATTNATVTMTLPSDYKGEPVCMSFIGKNSTQGGTVTFSGTAGVTGTLSTSDMMPGASLSRCPVVKRVTGLSAANAGQTIVATVTAVDASGAVEFDCWWLEALAAPPVIVCDIPRLTAAGYALYGSWSGTESSKDTDVQNFNSDIASVVAEFDGMVQIAYLDQALNKDSSLYSDGLHPNESGAAKIADALLTAVKRLTPTTSLGPAANMNTPAPRSGQMLRPRLSTFWYTGDCRGIGTNYTAVAQDMFAIPFQVTQPRDVYNRLAVEAIASVTGTTIRWGIYDDIGSSGYPQALIIEATSAGAFTITTGAGVKMNPSSGTGSLNFVPDPGLYWLVVKFITIGASHTFRTLAGPSWMMPNLTTGGAGSLQPSGWKLTGQGTTALSTVFPTGAALSDNCPVIAIQKK